MTNPPPSARGDVILQGHGLPNTNHTIWSTDDLSQSFTPLASVLADSNGDVLFTDEEFREVSRFYSLRLAEELFH